MKVKFILVLAILMGIMTTVLFFNYIQQLDENKEKNVPLAKVVTAKQAIKKNQRISASMLLIIQVPAQGLHPHTLKNVVEAEGKFADSDLEAGEVLLSHRLKQAEEESVIISRKIQAGYRAVTVDVNVVQSVANLIEPEDYVDVISTPAERNGQPTKSTLLLEKVRVLAIGRRMVEADDETPYVEYNTVTLELKPRDSVLLVNADELGNISLMLHSSIIPGA
jgi:pilus assembly protein CpaB